MIGITNNNSGATTIGAVFASKDFSATESDKLYVSPFRLLNLPATYNTARIILTSIMIPAVILFEFIFVSFMIEN
jgi:hypothetical protein